MRQKDQGTGRRRSGRRLVAIAAATVAVGVIVASAQGDVAFHNSGPGALFPGNLLISRSVYQAASITPGTTVLPPGCTSSCATATADGTYPVVFNNDAVDGSFGVTAPIYLDQVNPFSGHLVNTIAVPTSDLVTSFSSKSELALNLSTDGRYVTFMGYVAPTAALDVSNSNTPGAIDPTNPVPGAYYRVVAQLNAQGQFQFTETNAYSGNNGRAAILSEEHGAHAVYMAGNAGNGANPQPAGVVVGTGAQILKPSREPVPELLQEPGFPTPVGSFNVTQLGDKVDKIGKDTNFRGLTILNNVVYYTKGSGSNGVNTVYFLDTTGKACPNGVGLPAANAKLSSWPLAYNPEELAAEGLKPYNMCILKGFPTALAKKATSFPFGIWFANATTLYVAEEGNGENGYSTTKGEYTEAAAQTGAGLQKWVFNSTAGEWQLAYTLQNGLNLGKPYTVPGYPTGDNAATGLPWAPATDGLRNIDGRVNPNGTATIWAITSTVSGDGDQGADPNKLVAITDQLGATAPPASESFGTVRAATSGEVLRGISFTPGTGAQQGGYHQGGGFSEHNYGGR